MAKEVRIQLTEAQKAKIKAATGKTMAEIRVSSIGKNLAVAPGQKTTMAEAIDLETEADLNASLDTSASADIE